MARERLVKSVSTTSDSQGRATFTLGPAEQGYVYEGSVQVPNAPSGALLVATVLGTNWGQWAGPANFGPIQMYGGESLTVTATGLNPSTPYAMTFFGVWMGESEATPIPPAAPQSVINVESSTLLVNGPIVNSALMGTTGIDIRPPSLTRRLTVVIKNIDGVGLGPFLFVQGKQTGVVYFRQTNLFADLTGVSKEYFVAIEPTIDQTFNINTSGSFAGTFQIWVLASSTNPLVISTDYQPILVVPGHDANGTQVPFPGTGSPVGTFASSFDAVLGVGNNQQVIAAPALGRCIYLQTLAEQSGPGAGADVSCTFHTPGGLVIIRMSCKAPNDSKVASYPGGFRLPAATALQVDIVGALHAVSGTYTVGPTI